MKLIILTKEFYTEYSNCKEILKNDTYISTDHPTIESAEFAIIKKEEQKIYYQFQRFLHQYRKAMKRPDVPRNAKLIQYSALQYFDDYLQDSIN